MIVQLIVAFFLYYVMRYCFQNLNHWSPRIIWHMRKVPGPPGYPILGNATTFLGSPEHVWQVFRALPAKYPRFFKLVGLNVTFVYLLDPQDVEKVLSNPNISKKSIVYEWTKFWLGNGNLTGAGTIWKERRKMLNLSFNTELLRGFVAVFDAEVVGILKSPNLNETVNHVNVLPLATEFSLFALKGSLIGKEINITREEVFNHAKGIAEFADILVKRISTPWLIFDFIFWRTATASQFIKITNNLHRFTRRILNDRLLIWEKEKKSDKKVSSSKRMPLLDSLISEMNKGGNINFEGICEELDTFLFAGHDTTAMAITAMLMLIANNPECQEHIFKEQESIFLCKTASGSSDSATYEDLQRMEYLDRCVKEGLRLYPSVPYAGRQLETDIHLDGGIILPATMNVWVSVYDCHHNPKYWPNPEKFDPDRFLPENSQGRHPYAYIPFSSGLRSCIGQRYAVLSIKSLVSRICRNYVLEPIDTPKTVIFKADFVLRPSKSVQIKFIKRNHNQ